MLGLKRGTVLLAPHETGWETYAAETMKRLRAVLGDAAVEMQHVGSTAVPTIQAKPIVDLAVAVRQLSDVEPLFPALEAQGFYHAAHCDNEGQILLVCGDLEADTRTCHIHVVRAGSMEWRNYINFRDYLNFYHKKAAEYEALKQELQRRYPNDRSAYTEGKSGMDRLCPAQGAGLVVSGGESPCGDGSSHRDGASQAPGALLPHQLRLCSRRAGRRRGGTGRICAGRFGTRSRPLTGG